MKRKPARGRKPSRPVRARRRADVRDPGAITGLAADLAARPETGPGLTAGDVDADWQRAHHSGEEAVGGSVATPDQDVVDEIGRALGVAQGPEAEVRTSGEILRERDRLRWHLERQAADREERRAPPQSPRRLSPGVPGKEPPHP